MYKQIIIGIDQSYENTGISIAADGKLRKVSAFNLSRFENKSVKRNALRDHLRDIILKLRPQGRNIRVIIERIRLHSGGFINIDYIKSIGALNSVIVDLCLEYDIEVYSVDTKAWKSQIIGSAKRQSNEYGVPEEKYLTVKWTIEQGFEENILIKIDGKKKKNTFINSKNGLKYMYDTDASDSAGIALYGFLGDEELLLLET